MMWLFFLPTHHKIVLHTFIFPRVSLFESALHREVPSTIMPSGTRGRRERERERETVTKEAILIKAGRFTRLAGFKA